MLHRVAPLGPQHCDVLAAVAEKPPGLAGLVALEAPVDKVESTQLAQADQTSFVESTADH